MTPANPTDRFSNRVSDYVCYRPGYPRAILGLLRDEYALTPKSAIADVGSGTGILAKLFSRTGISYTAWSRMRRCGRQAFEPFAQASEVLLHNYGTDCIGLRAGGRTLANSRRRAFRLSCSRPGNASRSRPSGTMKMRCSPSFPRSTRAPHLVLGMSPRLLPICLPGSAS
jgi:hypothetical protein